MKKLLAVVALQGLAAGAAQVQVLDRIAVVVGSKAIKTSDIERHIRVTAFLNGEQPRFTTDEMRKAAERLIDQALIREQILRGGYMLPAPEDVEGMMEQIRKERFNSSAPALRLELQRYHFTEPELRAQLLWQFTVLRFIEQRFRPAVLVSEEEVRAYYQQRQAELRRQYPAANTLEALEPKIRATLEAERVDQNFVRWLEDTRKRTRIEYKPEVFS